MKFSLKKQILAAALAISFGAFAFTGGEAATRQEIASVNIKANGSNFKYWSKDAKALAALKDYMKEVTDKNNRNYIPKEDRIAVFDMDGTILCETAPIYFDHSLFLHRVYDDSSFKANDEQMKVAKNMDASIKKIGVPYPSSNNAKVACSAFTGMTMDEFNRYVKDFMEHPTTGLTNLKWGEAFYLPMVEIISFLAHNDFKVYIVSGTEREIARNIVLGAFPDIKTNQIIGTDIEYFAGNQGNAPSLKYVYQENDTIIRGPFVIKDLQMNKTAAIVREIGKQPVLAFGNAMSDASMLNYSIFNNKYKALAFGVICDDETRELGNPKRAKEMLDGCVKYNWLPISMKNDFKTIYGDNVKVVR